MPICCSVALASIYSASERTTIGGRDASCPGPASVGVPAWLCSRTAMRVRCRESVRAITMLIIHGAYHFWPKRVAFRDDYCVRCRAPRRAIAVRTFEVGHIFWIPMLPVGYWRHWTCTVCGHDPHKRRRTRRSFLWAGWLCLVAVSVILWGVPSDSDLGASGWILRMAAPLAAILLFIFLLRTPGDASLRERLAALPATADVVCPFCSAPLVSGTGERWSCPACNVVRY